MFYSILRHPFLILAKINAGAPGFKSYLYQGVQTKDGHGPNSTHVAKISKASQFDTPHSTHLSVQHLMIGLIYASTHRYSSKSVEAMAPHYSQHLHNTFLMLDCFSKHHLKIHVKLRHQQQDQNTQVNAESFQQPQRTPKKNYFPGASEKTKSLRLM